MKLIKARITNYRSIDDSNEFEVGDLTCMVGKNEAGKTGLLSALRGINPVHAFAYDRINDYPRRNLTKYDERHPDGRSRVVSSTWTLDETDIRRIQSEFGTNALNSTSISIEHGFGYENWVWHVDINHRACLEHLFAKHGLEEIEKVALKGAADCDSAIKILGALPQQSPKLTALAAQLTAYTKGFWGAITSPMSAPKFFYTSHFDRMSGKISLNKLAADRQHKTLSPGDKIFLDFIEYAGTTVEDLQKTEKTEELVATLEAASNDITEEIFQFWSQNDALEIKIELSEGRPKDDPPFHSGPVVTIRIYNSNHKAKVPLSERSAGFIWFFSFLAQFKQLQKTAGDAVLLLDEPGLTLHGKAQADLLRYIQERLLPKHQVLYTTHSPFMIPTERMDTVRIVEDVVLRPNIGRPIVEGTKVRSDALKVDRDTLFPLQGALGYEISQSLFVGKNCLLVEGPGDVAYLYAVSEALRKRSARTSLDPRWTICPTGGIDKITPFVALFSGNKLNLAVLTDIASGDRKKLDALRKSEILRAGHLFTAADVVDTSEADIEDFFHPALYGRLVDGAYNLKESERITEDRLVSADNSTTRLLKKTEALFKLFGTSVPEFNHYAPAEYLMRNPTMLDGESPEIQFTLDQFEKAFSLINACLPSSR